LARLNMLERVSLKRGTVYAWVLVVALAGGVGWKYKAKVAAETETKGGPLKGARTPTVEVTEAKAGEIVLKLSASGALESPNRVELAPRSSGQIALIAVREGDRVRAGQLLVQLDQSASLASLANAKAGLAEAKSRLAQAKIQKTATDSGVAGNLDQQNAGVTSAQNDLNLVTQNLRSQVEVAEAAVKVAESRVGVSRASLKSAESAVAREQASLANQKSIVERQQNLFEKGFVSEQILNNATTAREVQKRQVEVANSAAESARQQVKLSEADLGAAKASLGQTRRVGQTAIANAQARLSQAKGSLRVATGNSAQSPAFAENIRALAAAVSAAEAQVTTAEVAVRETALRSPVDGVVSARSADPGALASPGTPVLIVQSDGWLFFRASLPVENSGQVSTGFPVEIALASGEKIAGSVASVAGVADSANRRVTVLVKVVNASKNLKPGAFGEASFVLKRVQAGCVVPKEAVVEGTVAVLGGDNKVAVRTVKTGATDGRKVEILEGVTAGEKVVTMTYSRLKDGQEVKVPGAKKPTDKKSEKGEKK
jgi:RND family efflux transporter MFP subunit